MRKPMKQMKWMRSSWPYVGIVAVFICMTTFKPGEEVSTDELDEIYQLIEVAEFQYAYDVEQESDEEVE